MNCYYSNLNEGHDTHPVDIERALQNGYSDEPRKRDLRRRFGEHFPEELLWVEDPENGERVRMTPGELRSRDVIVGDHVADSLGDLPAFFVASNRSMVDTAKHRQRSPPRLPTTAPSGYTPSRW